MLLKILISILSIFYSLVFLVVALAASFLKLFIASELDECTMASPRGGEGDSDLYDAIRSRKSVHQSGVIVRVNTLAETETVKHVRASPTESEDEESDSESESSSSEEETKQVDKSEDGCIRIHSLESDDKILVPETKTLTSDVRPQSVQDNFVLPGPKQGFQENPSKEVRRRPVTARSSISQLSTLSSISSISTRASCASFNSLHAPVFGAHSSASWCSSKDRSHSSSIEVNNLDSLEAIQFETALQNLFQLSLEGVNDSFDEWRSGGFFDKTWNMKKLSEYIYYRDVEFDEEKEDPGHTFKYHLTFGRILDHPAQFALLPTPANFMLRCRITRCRKGIDGRLHPVYYLHLEQKGRPAVLLLSAKRSNVVKSDYVISINPADFSLNSESCVGIIEANLRGTACMLKRATSVDNPDSDNEDIANKVKGDSFAHLENRRWADFMYIKFYPHETNNTFSTKGPRQLKAAFPKLKSLYEYCRPMPGSFTKSMSCDQVASVNNREPRWNSGTGTYVLNFGSRVQQSSVKNFQLHCTEGELDLTLLQFGRTRDKNAFILDFQYPFCPLQAFAIGLASFDLKWALD